MTEMQTILLRLLDRFTNAHTYWSTADLALMVGRQPGQDSDRQHSALISRELRALEKAGRVARLDGRKSILWRIA